ncbi:hypothetical protein [Celeribacter marinus]|uniref:Uncharacterized protein n=1 Tax=Celeribacter marinus TaxID=1397108 RepID=A0A0N9ZG49_9RHOB|nr:hypothetical protein [Celeribacter marinus]ALI55916.1 hypothetical protein IMCC12053_1969 [Celeribacter marinus]SFK88709.1 hypothetical protein SAMN05444421_1106 [Celeribacter marinus]
MKLYSAQVSDLTFDAATQQFQADVIFHEGGEQVTYPVELSAPFTASFETVSRGLMVRARAIRKQERGASIASLKSIASQTVHIRYGISPVT